ncbi:MAG TPA: VOC family protein [Acidimicrobiales bacterium]|nr:VOC family protein [Acidimicrobiales bacterium]
MDLRGVGYLGFAVPDPDAWCKFATSVIGLMPAPAPPKRDDTIYLKGDERQWRIALHPIDQGNIDQEKSDKSGLAYVGFELGSPTAFDAAKARLAEMGIPATPGSEDEVEARGVRDFVHVVDPSGVRIELYWGPTLDGGFVSPAGVPQFVAGELGFGHYVLLVPDLDKSMAFYGDVLGMKLSDYVIIGPNMSVQFLRCTPRHHSVALTAVGPISALHHVAFEVTDIDQVGYALERATRAGCPITATLGRHKNDRMLSFYMRSPAGFEVEVGCGGRLVDDATWVVSHNTGGDEWGHHGLTADSLSPAGAS